VFEVVGNFLEPTECLVVKGIFEYSWFLSFSCNYDSEGSGEYNDHIHHIMCKGKQ
jgi:hypothetical protein